MTQTLRSLSPALWGKRTPEVQSDLTASKLAADGSLTDPVVQTDSPDLTEKRLCDFSSDNAGVSFHNPDHER